MRSGHAIGRGTGGGYLEARRTQKIGQLTEKTELEFSSTIYHVPPIHELFQRAPTTAISGWLLIDDSLFRPELKGNSDGKMEGNGYKTERMLGNYLGRRGSMKISVLVGRHDPLSSQNSM